ncbi:MAG: FmdB family zinc ribbon protein [Verrucomicrobiota bacterium]
MPNYDYVCDTCGQTFEVFQSMTAPRLEACPDEACRGQVRRKIGTGAGIIFKGSGFYQTDYRSDSYKKGADAEKAPSKESKASKSEGQSTSSEAKPKASSGGGDSKK